MEKLAALSPGLVKGDMVRIPAKSASLYVFDGSTMPQQVRPPSVRPEKYREQSSVKIAVDSGGDLSIFWDALRSASDLLLLLSRTRPDRKLLGAAACDCAQTVLRFVPGGEERPGRALRRLRQWVAGAAAGSLVDAAATDALMAAQTLQKTARALQKARPYYAAMAAYNAAYTVADLYSAVEAAAGVSLISAISASRDDAERSMAFLVRAGTPSWRICLAMARKVEP